MQYQFKQSVHLAGRDYPVGVYVLSESAENDPNFPTYVKSGYIVESANAHHLVETPRQRAERLLARFKKPIQGNTESIDDGKNRKRKSR